MANRSPSHRQLRPHATIAGAGVGSGTGSAGRVRPWTRPGHPCSRPPTQPRVLRPRRLGDGVATRAWAPTPRTPSLGRASCTVPRVDVRSGHNLAAGPSMACAQSHAWQWHDNDFLVGQRRIPHSRQQRAPSSGVDRPPTFSIDLDSFSTPREIRLDLVLHLQDRAGWMERQGISRRRSGCCTRTVDLFHRHMKKDKVVYAAAGSFAAV